MKTSNTIKCGRLHRGIVNEGIKVNDDDRTIELSFSSELPYERFFGVEILGHDAENVRMGRLLNKGPLLVDHDPTDHVGVIEEAWIGTDRRGRARVRFGSGQRASEVFQDVKDGIRNHVSVGYYVHGMEQMERGAKGEVETYRVTDWEPLEISFVSIAADDGVGVGRATDDHETTVVIRGKETRVMEDTNNIDQAEIDLDNIRVKAADKAREDESRRQKDIRDAAAMLRGTVPNVDELSRQFLDNGQNIGAFLEAVKERQGKQPAIKTSPEIGLTDKEARAFSYVKALRALASPNDVRLQEAAAFEREVSSAIDAKHGTVSKGIRVPFEKLNLRAADMTVGTAGDGGYLKGTDHLGASFIEQLYNRAMVMRLGATVLPGLVGDVAIPKQSGSATGAWVSEDSAASQSNLTLGQVSLSPNTYSARTDISRKLLLQSSPAADMLVQNDLVKVIALGIDLAAIHGSGTGEPAGIAPIVSDAIDVSVSGVNSVVGGANGLAPTLAQVVGLETAVAVDNADFGTCAYLTNAKGRGYFKQTFPNTTGGDRPLWADGSENGFGIMNGYRAAVSNQVTSTVDKGSSTDVASAIIFGDFSQLLVGMWSTLDLTVDPYSQSSTGALRIVAFQDVDIALRHPEAFAVMPDALFG